MFFVLFFSFSILLPSQQHTIIPLSTLKSNSPYIKALLNDLKIVTIDNDTIDEENPPPFQQFVSIRLESLTEKKDLIKGIICVLDNKIIDPTRLATITTLLDAVHDRCINEINQIQEHEQIIGARDLASLDAENKLKFLADMSHEIR